MNFRWTTGWDEDGQLGLDSLLRNVLDKVGALETNHYYGINSLWYFLHKGSSKKDLHKKQFFDPFPILIRICPLFTTPSPLRLQTSFVDCPKLYV